MDRIYGVGRDDNLCKVIPKSVKLDGMKWKKVTQCTRRMEYWSIGVLEYWKKGNGRMESQRSEIGTSEIRKIKSIITKARKLESTKKRISPPASLEAQPPSPRLRRAREYTERAQDLHRLHEMEDINKLVSPIPEASLLRMLTHSQPPFLTEDLTRRFLASTKKVNRSKSLGQTFS